MKRALVLVLLLLAGIAHAHDLRPGILAFVEDEPGELRMRFVPPIDNRGEAIELAVALPDGCTRKGERVRCKDGFGGVLAVGGMRGHAMKIYVSLERAGVRSDWVITSDAPRLELGPAPSRLDRLGIMALALLAGLALVFGPSLRLLMAVAAFVAAEALAGMYTVAGPFAACAAVSVVLVAREAVLVWRGAARSRNDADDAHGALAANVSRNDPFRLARIDASRASLLVRWPWLTGALFGAVHGLAFAPRPIYLAGQVVAAGVFAALVALAAHLVGERRVVGLRAHRAAGYALGALAAYWLLAHLARG